MNTWAVVATGESLKPEPALVTAKIKHLPTVAVANAYVFAPWAKALVACDRTWWQKHPEALGFPGEKWCANGSTRGVLQMRGPGIYTNTNSGLLGLMYAVGQGAKRVLLLGIDMKGTHYFGRYTNGCENTAAGRFPFFIKQFEDFKQRIPGVQVINCSLDSALDCFTKMSLDDALAFDEVAA